MHSSLVSGVFCQLCLSSTSANGTANERRYFVGAKEGDVAHCSLCGGSGVAALAMIFAAVLLLAVVVKALHSAVNRYVEQQTRARVIDLLDKFSLGAKVKIL